MSNKPLTYSSYLRIDELLGLQSPRSDGPEHDEMLFIIIHQIYELWFKQILHELGALTRSFDADDTGAALATFKRLLTILKTLVAQVDVLETMTPLSFNAFRARLEAASGFQSAQFRALEFRLGHKRRAVLDGYPQASAGRALLEQAWSAPTLYDHFLHYLARHGWPIPRAILMRDVTEAYAGSPEVQTLLVELYRRDGLEMQICERFVDLDEGLQEWRYRHVKMVERTIGAKPGTGGSSGVDYLRGTLFRSLFPDLWMIRAQL
ncbi:tryptophan 2,3-dioxygenase [Fontimonas thermophila]|uniref:Tryptophan 2,3-dioxygenase n=1 Tax=Fontimonas thermophila TaxID=1076937 RepID=A0A1I2IQ38_9GAMM|nr:tryptophan 2,3-dioxygenase family protein [Fontimonas thermophila]SFF44389.1 tryptophan 2,3-dioxygenase [Fontimonas thermophila]